MKEGSWSLCVTSRTCWTVLIQALPPNLVSKVFQRLLSKTHFQKWEVVPLTCPYSLNSITDSAGQSKNDWRGNVLHHLLTSQLPSPITHRFSPPHITMIYPSYALQRHTNYLKSRWVKWGTGEQCLVRLSSRKQCKTWQQRTIQELCVVCALTCYNYREDTLELEEDDLILLLDVLHHTNEVVTVAEAAESVEMTETAVDEVQHERIPRRRKRRCESDFFYYE